MGWLKEWDKCVFKRANPVKKRRFNDDEEDPYVRRSCSSALTLDGLPWQTKGEGKSYQHAKRMC
jgi:hypothetical protein